MALVSKDLFILQAITTHLQGITVLGGYDFDLANSVFRGRSLFGDELPIPCLNIVEAPRGDDPTSFAGDFRQTRAERWALLVQGWADDDIENPTDPVFPLKATTEQRLSQIVADRQDGGMGGVYPNVFRIPGPDGKPLITNMLIGPGIVSGPRQEISNRAFFFLPLTIDRVYDPSNPYVNVP